jgi:Phage terminase large subunit (GpA)/Intein splicing domain
MKSTEIGFNELFYKLRDGILSLDPVYFCAKYLTVDGKPLKLEGTGYKPFADIYRYIAFKAIEATSKPIVLVKGRQVGATTMAAALECYFSACGLFGTNERAPMRMMHLFPTLSLAAAYTKDKLDPIIGHAIPVPGMMKSNGILKSYMEARLDLSSPTNNNMHFKKFLFGNQVWIESTGIDGDRIRGRTVDSVFFDECFPFDQYIKTNIGREKIGKLYKMYEAGNELPLVETYNEDNDIFEYKRIIRAWKREKKELVLVRLCNGKIKCTPNHLFLTTFGWVEAAKLQPGDLVLSTPNATCNYNWNSEYKKAGLVVVKSISVVDKKEFVYDLEVADNHNFIATSSRCSLNNGGVIVHNCQDMGDVAIGAATKVLAQSRYGAPGEGVQVYYGTPKTKGGSYWNMWQNSSQNYFHLRCEKCGKYFPLYHPSINWEEVWIYGLTVRCTECHHEQDKLDAQERGRWIPLNDPEKCDFVGYHINQLYIPHFTKETIDKAKPERSPINTERVYMNEVLGEFYDGEGGTITAQEIREKCIDKGRKMVKYIFPESGKRVYAGFDWGQRGALEQIAGRGRKGSYSCAVILTVSGNIFNIEFATRLLRPDPETKKSTVEEMFRRYNMALSVGDIGDAYDLTHQLQRTYDEKFLASRSSHRVNGHIKYSNDEWPKTIVFEKDYYISEILGLLKDGRIKFPGGSLDRIEWLIEHCASMDIKVTRDKSGEPLKKYVKGSGANDGLMALLNAYLAWKFDVTQGFTISNPQHMKYEITTSASPIQAVIGYVPKMFGGRG